MVNAINIINYYTYVYKWNLLLLYGILLCSKFKNKIK